MLTMMSMLMMQYRAIRRNDDAILGGASYGQRRCRSRSSWSCASTVHDFRLSMIMYHAQIGSDKIFTNRFNVISSLKLVKPDLGSMPLAGSIQFYPCSQVLKVSNRCLRQTSS